MADRDAAEDNRQSPAGTGNIQQSGEELMESVEGEGPTNEEAGNAVRALGNHDGEQPQERPVADEDEESKKLKGK